MYLTPLLLMASQVVTSHLLLSPARAGKERKKSSKWESENHRNDKLTCREQELGAAAHPRRVRDAKRGIRRVAAVGAVSRLGAGKIICRRVPRGAALHHTAHKNPATALEAGLARVRGEGEGLDAVCSHGSLGNADTVGIEKLDLTAVHATLAAFL